MPVFMAALVLVGLLVAIGFSLLLPQGGSVPVYGTGDNGKTISTSDGSKFIIRLEENPTTGFAWNESVTSGLTIVDSKYISGGNMPGAGGIHEYTIKASGKGQQQFSAIYKRSWEPTTGNETKYLLTVSVN